MSSSAFSNRQIRNTPITLPQLSTHGRWCNVMCSGLHISAVTYTAKLLLSQGNAIAKVRSLIMNLNIKKQNCPFPWRDPSPHLIRDSLGPLNSLFQTACQLGQSYFCSSPETMHILYNGAGHAPPNCQFSLVPWAHPSPKPEWHLDCFSCFCRAHSCDQQTLRQTDHGISVARASHSVHATRRKLENLMASWWKNASNNTHMHACTYRQMERSKTWCLWRPIEWLVEA